MPRMINADSLMQAMQDEWCSDCEWLGDESICDHEHCTLDSLFRMVKAQPTVDAVEVVHCKDCKWWIPEKIEKTEWFISETGAHCGRVDSVNVHGYRNGEPSHDITLLWMPENSFCSYGERKDDGKE